MLRVAEAPTPPQRFTDFATALSGYLTEIKQLVDQRRGEDERRSIAIGDDVFRLASDPKNPVSAPKAVTITPRMDFTLLEQAIDRVRSAAMSFDAAYATRQSTLDQARRDTLNAQLRDIDQLLLDDRGLPGRPWYRNLIAAPGRYTGYTAKTLPGVREAIEERRFADAETYIRRTAAVLVAYAARLDKANQAINRQTTAITIQEEF